MASPKTLTTDEVTLLLHAFAGDDVASKRGHQALRNYTMTILMLDAGLRVGEAVKLRRSDLYFNCEPVTSIIVRADIAKNETERTIPVSQRLTNALKMYFPLSTTIYPAWYHEFAFRSQTWGYPITTRQVERIIRQAALKSLGRPIHPHVLRHTFASRLMRKTNMRTVQELLGHKNLSSTQIYTHPNGDDLRKAIDSLDNRDDVYKENGRTQNSPTGVSNRLDTPGTDRNVR